MELLVQCLQVCSLHSNIGRGLQISVSQPLNRRVSFFVTKRRIPLRAVFEKLKLPFLKSVEEEFITEFITVMKPLAEALDVLQGDIHVSIGYLLPTLTVLLNELEDLKRSSSLKHCKALPSLMIEAIKTRFDGYFEDQELRVAAIVHPRFKMHWVKEEEKISTFNRFKEIVRAFEETQNIGNDGPER